MKTGRDEEEEEEAEDWNEKTDGEVNVLRLLEVGIGSGWTDGWVSGGLMSEVRASVKTRSTRRSG